MGLTLQLCRSENVRNSWDYYNLEKNISEQVIRSGWTHEEKRVKVQLPEGGRKYSRKKICRVFSVIMQILITL